MFIQALTELLDRSAEPENVPVPRPYDELSEKISSNAMRAMRSEFALCLPTDRIRNNRLVRENQLTLRESLTALIWVSPSQSVIERLTDLLGLLCAEYSWSASAILSDDPAHPEIDLQAAETGVLIAWVLRRHGARLDERDPRVSATAREQLRRRLFAPIVNHDDYPFMTGEGICPVVILCDILIAALLTERSYQRRSQPVKKALRLLDKCTDITPEGYVPLRRKLSEACALADTARIIKRMTRGQIDLTDRVPNAARLDDLLSPYLGSGCFLDPCGPGLESDLSGIDLFRLGYFSGDEALRSLGAMMLQCGAKDSYTVTGSILSMEYYHDAYKEDSLPPRLKRAIISDGTLMLTRCDRFTCAASSRGNRSNAGDITLFYDDAPVICDLGGTIHSLPLIDGEGPLKAPPASPCEDSFSDARDLISMDLTEIYPEESALSVYQRTLMLSRQASGIRLVDAFEFDRIPESITFRFTTPCRCAIEDNSIRLGPLLLTWDGEMKPMIQSCGDGYVVQLTLTKISERLICGFGFEIINTAPEGAAAETTTA